MHRTPFPKPRRMMTTSSASKRRFFIKQQQLLTNNASCCCCCCPELIPSSQFQYYHRRHFSSTFGGGHEPPSNHDSTCSSSSIRRSEKGGNNNNNGGGGGPISSFVLEQIQVGQLQKDPEQLDLAHRLDALLHEIIETDCTEVHASKLTADWFSDTATTTTRPAAKGGGGALLDKIQSYARNYYRTLRSRLLTTTVTPKGIYICGSVGVGKSFLMDLFHEELKASSTRGDAASTTTTTTTTNRRKIRRSHFNEFMLDIHQRIHDFKQLHPRGGGGGDPLPYVALSLAQEARVLCLDEFQVTDIADAAILKRLFTMLWNSDMGMVVVATSNRDPDALYEGGLNRSLFLPFIDTLKRNMTIIEMRGAKDYRREETTTTTTHDRSSGYYQQCYHWPANNDKTRQALDAIFDVTGDDDDDDRRVVKYHAKIPVRMGRQVIVPRSNDSCAWFDFEDLCDRPLGAADYLAICLHYQVLIVDRVPQLNASRFNQARRFVTLIDAVYESRTRLIVAADVPLEELLVDFEATVETQDGDEEIAAAAIQDTSTSDGPKTEETLKNTQEGMFVKGEGGSSSSAATTMIQTKEGTVEWSATGRIGVSLAQLSAVQEVSFSFQRAESRLFEMNKNGGIWDRPKEIQK